MCSVFVSAFLSTEVIYDKFEHLYTSQSPVLMLQNKQLVLINLSCKKWLPGRSPKKKFAKNHIVKWSIWWQQMKNSETLLPFSDLSHTLTQTAGGSCGHQAGVNRKWQQCATCHIWMNSYHDSKSLHVNTITVALWEPKFRVIFPWREIGT